MKRLNNLKKVPIEIAKLLSSSEKLQRLLIIDKEDVNSKDFKPHTFNELMEGKYISFVPLDDAIKNIGRNTFIIITFDTTDFSYCEGSIYLGTDAAHTLLVNNEFRLLEMIDEVVKKLDGEKISAAGTINISTANKVVYSEFTFGYKLYFSVRDQNSEEYDI